MNRREMLHKGLRHLAKSWPLMLGGAVGLGGLLKDQVRPPVPPPKCFPAKSKGPQAAETQNIGKKED